VITTAVWGKPSDNHNDIDCALENHKDSNKYSTF